MGASSLCNVNQASEAQNDEALSRRPSCEKQSSHTSQRNMAIQLAQYIQSVFLPHEYLCRLSFFLLHRAPFLVIYERLLFSYLIIVNTLISRDTCMFGQASRKTTPFYVTRSKIIIMSSVCVDEIPLTEDDVRGGVEMRLPCPTMTTNRDMTY